MQKTIGIIGGIGPESTLDYYKKLVDGYRQMITDGSYPRVIINCIDLKEMLDLIAKRQFGLLVEALLIELDKLKAAGAEFAAMASNTPHIIFNELQPRSPLRLLSIVDATVAEIKKSGLKKVALWGTKTTMNGGFYKNAAEKAGIKVIIPNIDQQELIHSKYFDELVLGIFKDETLNKYKSIGNDMKKEYGIKGIILGGTELPLLIKQESFQDLKLFDTSALHVNKILDYALDF